MALVVDLIWFIWASVALCRNNPTNYLWISKRRLGFLLAVAFLVSFFLHSVDSYYRTMAHGYKERTASAIYLAKRYVVWAFQFALVALLKTGGNELGYNVAATDENIELAEKYHDNVDDDISTAPTETEASTI